MTIGRIARQLARKQRRASRQVVRRRAYFRIRKDPDTNVGYRRCASRRPNRRPLSRRSRAIVDGPPLLAVEVLSPYDKQKEIDEMIAEYHAIAGVPPRLDHRSHATKPCSSTGRVPSPRYSTVSKNLRPTRSCPGFRCQSRRDLRVAPMPVPFAVASIRDFYAFEQHVKTCRAHRGLDMVPQWYQVPVFYFSNPVCVIGDGRPGLGPAGQPGPRLRAGAGLRHRQGGPRPARRRSAMECVAGFTIMNDWSARDLQRVEMAVGLGPSKSKDFATSLGPEAGDVRRTARLLPRRPAAPGDDRGGQRHAMLSRGNAGSMYWTWPQLLAHASRDTGCGPATCSAPAPSAPAASWS